MITYARKRRASSMLKAEQQVVACTPCQTAESGAPATSLSADISHYQAVIPEGAWTTRHQAGQVAKRSDLSRQQSRLALGNRTNTIASSTEQVNMLSPAVQAKEQRAHPAVTVPTSKTRRAEEGRTTQQCSASLKLQSTPLPLLAHAVAGSHGQASALPGHLLLLPAKACHEGRR